MDTSSGARRKSDVGQADLIRFSLPHVTRICAHRLAGLSHADVEEAIQETYLQFFEAGHVVIANPMGWILRVAVNVCNQRLRRLYQPERLVRDVPAASRDHTDYPDMLAASNLWLSKVAESLTHHERQLLTWLYGDGLTYNEIAATLDTTPGNARVLAHRARRHARQVIQDLDL